jgi:hypothetical protein
MPSKSDLRTSSRAAALACAALLGSGCAAEGGADAAFEVTDSAGVTIAMSHRPAWGDGEGWRVEAEPALVIGSTEGDPAHVLSSVRRAIRLANGNVAVFDEAAQEVRFFDPSGHHIRTVGRQGQGPGEFRSGDMGGYRGDSIFVYDMAMRRLTVLDSAGALGRMADTRTVVGQSSWWRGPAGDGGFVLEPSGGPPNRAVDFAWDSTLVFTVSAALDVVDTLGPWPYATADRGRNLVTTVMAYVAPSPAGFFRGLSDRWVIDEYTLDGRHLRSLRRAWEPRPMSPGLRDSLLLRYGDQENTRMEVAFHEHLPTFSWLRTDAEGNLWVRRYATSSHRDHNPWDVFDTDGRWLGAVTMPDGLLVVQIGADFVLGVHRDALGVETVRLHRMTFVP